MNDDDDKELSKAIIELLRELSKNPEHKEVILTLLEGLIEEKSNLN